MQYILSLFIVFVGCDLVFAQNLSFSNPDWSVIKGRPRVLREGTMTEVFFYEHSGSFSIANGDSYNEVYNGLNRALKANTTVGVVVNIKKRLIMRLESAVAKEANSNAGTGSSSTASPAPGGSEEEYFQGRSSGGGGVSSTGSIKPSSPAGALKPAAGGAGLPAIAIPAELGGGGVQPTEPSSPAVAPQSGGWKD
jgi:hypothetical protein